MRMIRNNIFTLHQGRSRACVSEVSKTWGGWRCLGEDESLPFGSSLVMQKCPARNEYTVKTSKSPELNAADPAFPILSQGYRHRLAWGKKEKKREKDWTWNDETSAPMARHLLRRNDNNMRHRISKRNQGSLKGGHWSVQACVYIYIHSVIHCTYVYIYVYIYVYVYIYICIYIYMYIYIFYICIYTHSRHVLSFNILHLFASHRMASHCTTLRSIAWHWVAFQYIILQHITLYIVYDTV